MWAGIAIVTAWVWSVFASACLAQPCNVADVSEVGGTAELPGIPDTQLTVDDVIVFLQVFGDAAGCPGASPCNLADITGIGGLPEGPDGQITVDDVVAFMNVFGDGCPPVVTGNMVATEMVHRELGSSIDPLSVIMHLDPGRATLTMRVMRKDNLEEEIFRTLPSRVVSGPIWLTGYMPDVEPGSMVRDGIIGVTAVGTSGVYHALARVFEYNDGQGSLSEVVAPVLGYASVLELGPVPAQIAADPARRTEFVPTDGCNPPVPNSDETLTVLEPAYTDYDVAEVKILKTTTTESQAGASLRGPYGCGWFPANAPHPDLACPSRPADATGSQALETVTSWNFVGSASAIWREGILLRLFAAMQITVNLNIQNNNSVTTTHIQQYSYQRKQCWDQHGVVFATINREVRARVELYNITHWYVRRHDNSVGVVTTRCLNRVVPARVVRSEASVIREVPFPSTAEGLPLTQGMPLRDPDPWFGIRMVPCCSPLFVTAPGQNPCCGCEIVP